MYGNVCVREFVLHCTCRGQRRTPVFFLGYHSCSLWRHGVSLTCCPLNKVGLASESQRFACLYLQNTGIASFYNHVQLFKTNLFIYLLCMHTCASKSVCHGMHGGQRAAL